MVSSDYPLVVAHFRVFAFCHYARFALVTVPQASVRLMCAVAFLLTNQSMLTLWVVFAPGKIRR